MNLQDFIQTNSFPNEQWKNIPYYENLYMVSSYGRIIAKEKYVNNGHKDVIKQCKILKNSIDSNHVTVQLYNGLTKKKVNISKLVAQAFLPNPSKNYILKFKDGNPLNCISSNLIWTPKIDRHAKFIIDSLEGEEWRDIINYEGLYKVSNKGRILSVGRQIKAANRIIISQNRILNPTSSINNYLYVTLCKNCNQKRFFIHRLVAQAFIENSNSYPHIDHIDTNKHNNNVENLRWVTPKMNMENVLTRQHLSKVRKNNNINFTWNCTPIVQLTKNNELVKIYPSIAEASRDGFEYTCIQKCLSNRQRTHKNFKWVYLFNYLQSSEIASAIIEWP